MDSFQVILIASWMVLAPSAFQTDPTRSIGGANAKKWFARSILYQIRMSLAQNLGKWIAITLYVRLFRFSSPIGHTASWKAEILVWIGHLANYGSRL